MANKKTALKRAKKEARRREQMQAPAAPEPIRGQTKDLVMIDEYLPPTGTDDATE